MKKSIQSLLLGLLFLLTAALTSHAQRTITVSGGCIDGSVVLTEDGVNFGKPYFEGTGSVNGATGITITITWISVNSAWFLRFNGGPYYEYATDTPLPVNNTTGAWARIPPSPAQASFCPTGNDGNLAISDPVSSGPPLSLGTPTVTNLTCFRNNSGSISVTASGGTGSYTYTLNPGGTSNTTGTFTGLAAGTNYIVSVTDAASGSASTGSIIVTEPAVLLITSSSDTDLKCNGDNSGSISIGGTGGTGTITYVLNTGATNTSGEFTGLPAGQYSVRLRDENNCLSPGGIVKFINQPFAVTFTGPTVTNLTCNGDNSGAISISASGGTGGKTYTISPAGGSQDSPGDFTGLAAGDYTISATDANNCSVNSGVISVTEPAAITFSTATVAVKCMGGSDGSITVNASGGTGTLMYSKDNGVTYQASNAFAGLSSGTYQIKVKDAEGCETSTRPSFVPEPAEALSFAATPTDVLCNGGSDGSISVDASGGTPDYLYSNDNGVTYGSSSTFTGLAVGSYQIRVRNANSSSCETAAQSIAVGEPAAITFSTATTAVKCKGGSDGSITVDASGGTPGYTYSKDNGATFQTANAFTGLTSGTYQIKVKDAEGCETSTRPSFVPEPAEAISAVTVTGNTSVIFGFGSSCTTLTASASGGTGTLTYTWMPDGTPPGNLTGPTQELCPTETTTYTVTATDGNNCTNSTQVTVNVQNVRCGNRDNKVEICYYGVTQCVSEKIAKRYLKLGATVGGCGSGAARIGYESAEAPLQLSLKAYPNPVQDAVTVEVLAPNAGVATLQVLDMSGRTKQSRRENLVEGLNQVEFRLGGLPSGVYLIRAVDALNRQGVVKVSKE